jgi:hypothetical protein
MNLQAVYNKEVADMTAYANPSAIARKTWSDLMHDYLGARGDLWLTMAILVVGLLVGIGIIYTWRTLFGVGILGMFTFFIVLVAGMVTSSPVPILDQGQVRRAVVAAWVVAFFGLLAVGNGIVATGSVIANTLSQFWWAFTLIFTTYIAGRTVESVTQTLKGTKAGAQPKAAAGPGAQQVAAPVTGAQQVTAPVTGAQLVAAPVPSAELGVVKSYLVQGLEDIW